LEDNILAGHDIGSGGLITTLLEMCFADNNLGAKIDFSVLKRKTSSNIYLQRISELYFRQKTMLHWKASKQCRFLQNGNCYYRSDLDLGPSKLDIAKYRDIWFKTSFY
jgi:phosphoribosylformylglycinamidine synthase